MRPTFVPMDADQAGELFVRLKELEIKMVNHMDDLDETNYHTYARALVRLGRLMGKLECGKVTADELSEIALVISVSE